MHLFWGSALTFQMVGNIPISKMKKTFIKMQMKNDFSFLNPKFKTKPNKTRAAFFKC